MANVKKTIIPYDDYNSRIPPPTEWDCIGTITPNCGTTALRNGWKIIEVYECEEENSADKHN